MQSKQEVLKCRKGGKQMRGWGRKGGQMLRGRAEQRGPAVQPMVRLQLDIKTVFSVSESSENHQSLRFWGLEARFNLQPFPTAFQGLPNIYLFWINVINPSFLGVTQKKRVTVKRLHVLCFSYEQPGPPSTVAQRFHITGIVFLL